MAVARRITLVALLTAVVLALGASSALASVTIHENAGVGKARLGRKDDANTAYLGKVTAYYEDTAYSSPTYCYAFGKRLAYHRYALQMFSNSHHVVFEFACNTAKYVTTKGVKVGSTKARLKAKYGSKLKRHAAGQYWRYTLGNKPYTDFYVKKKTGRVFEIIVRSR